MTKGKLFRVEATSLIPEFVKEFESSKDAAVYVGDAYESGVDYETTAFLMVMPDGALCYAQSLPPRPDWPNTWFWMGCADEDEPSPQPKDELLENLSKLYDELHGRKPTEAEILDWVKGAVMT